jgi:hypothetical protein
MLLPLLAYAVGGAIINVAVAWAVSQCNPQRRGLNSLSANDIQANLSAFAGKRRSRPSDRVGAEFTTGDSGALGM